MKRKDGQEDPSTRPELKLIHSQGAENPVVTHRQLVEDYAEAIDQNVLIADGFDEAIIGYCEAWDGSERPMKAVYSREKCINILQRDMSRTEAEEYFEFNVAAAYMGPNTPVFVELF